MAEGEREGFSEGGENSGIDQQAVERKARAVGWVPETEFRGDKSKWVSADEFLDRADHVMPILRTNNARLQEQLAARDREIAELRQTTEESKRILQTLQDAQDETSVKNIEERLEVVRSELAEAMKSDDTERAVALQEELTDLKADLKLRQSKDDDDEGEETPPGRTDQPIKPTQEQVAEFNQWKAENPWYNDPAMVAVANVYSVQIIREAMANGEQPPKGRALLDEVTKRVDNRFNVSQRPDGDKVEGDRGGARTPTGGGKRFADLPAAARQACQAQSAKFVGAGKRYKTIQEWQARFTEVYYKQPGAQ